MTNPRDRVRQLAAAAGWIALILPLALVLLSIALVSSEQLDGANDACRILHPGDRPTGCGASRHDRVTRLRDHPVSSRRRSNPPGHRSPRRCVPRGIWRVDASARHRGRRALERLDVGADRLVCDCGRRIRCGLAVGLSVRDGLPIGLCSGARPLLEPRLFRPAGQFRGADVDCGHSRRPRAVCRRCRAVARWTRRSSSERCAC